MANTLTVTFNYMFLLVRNVVINKVLQHVVLLPNGAGDHKLSYPHQSSLAIGNSAAKAISGDYFIGMAGAAGDGSADMLPLPNLLRMKDVPTANKNGQVRPELLQQTAFPPDLGARIWLPAGGTFAADLPVSRKLMTWHLCDRYHNDFNQKLSDQLVYTLDLPKATYSITEPTVGPPTPQPLPAGSSLLFTNDDAVGSTRPVDWRVLDDFIEMFRLCVVHDEKEPWPVPVLDQTDAQTVVLTAQSSDPERPICGGGQGCDVDPTKCP